MPSLNFDSITPLASHALGGLPQNHFSNGRIFATVAAHGGITDLSYWGNQHLGAAHFFRAAPITAWNRLFRFALLIDEKRYFPVLQQTQLFPFGLRSQCEVEGITFQYDLVLLPDALVQRIEMLSGHENRTIGLEVLHQEAITAVPIENRVWSDMTFDPESNALVASCTDFRTRYQEEALAQDGFDSANCDLATSTTWVAASCDAPLTARRGYHARSKYCLKSALSSRQRIASYVIFAGGKNKLDGRLQTLANDVHAECDELFGRYETSLTERPALSTGSPVLDSAFGQYPAIIDGLKVTERPGAVRATASGYWVWGWDGMMPLLSSTLANDAGHSAEVLRFFHETLDPKLGIPHTFTTGFTVYGKGPFPAQAQFICGLYLYVSMTNDLALAREVWPTCRFILDRCREREVGNSGLVSGCALWPDFPEAMEENGEDVSSMNNSLLYQGLRGMEYLAAALGESALAEECRDWAVRLRKSFVQHLFDEKKGYFISSCSSRDFSPRSHYCAQAVFWFTPFASELVSHAPTRIARFMDEHLCSAKCLLTLPHWDTAWMADGNQLGSSFPAADSFYLGVHKILADDSGLEKWLGDVEWFWQHHTAPEAFTPEAENEHELGPDNTGTKQLQALTTWYAGAYLALAGMDFDHEGINLTPWGNRPLTITGLRLRGVSVDLEITGSGNHVGSLTLNGEAVPAGSRKILWSQLTGMTAPIELVRSQKPPGGPVIVRADGLRVEVVESAKGTLCARISGTISGEIVVQASASAMLSLDGKASLFPYDSSTGTFTIPFQKGKALEILCREDNHA